MTGEPPAIEPVPGQLPLPLGDEALPAPPQGKPRKVTYARIKPVQRTSCDDCRRTLHRLGVARGQRPQAARWRRTGPDGEIDLLCPPCKDARTDAER